MQCMDRMIASSISLKTVCSVVLYLLDYCTVLFLCNRYNRLTALPESLCNCGLLEDFNIENNNITYLPVCCLFPLIFNDLLCFGSDLQ